MQSVEPSPGREARPHVREFLADSLTPLGVYRRLAAVSPIRFLFESVSGGERVSRYSFLGAGPWGVVRVFPDHLQLEREGKYSRLAGPLLEQLRRVLGAIRVPQRNELPFSGGFLGYFGYDFVRLLERLPEAPPDPFGLPAALLARFDHLVVFDHVRQRVLAISNEIPGEIDRQRALQRLQQLSKILTDDVVGSAVEVPSGRGRLPAAAASLDGADFRTCVAQVKREIAVGEIFQAVLARRWRIAAEIEPFLLYRALRMVNPSPYMVLFETPEVALVGASPEMLVRVSAGRVEARPIASTRPRANDSAQDRRLSEELLADSKERAEHVMLVNLARNDLGRVSKADSVRLASFMEVERYSHVMHLVSSVEGELAPDRDGLDALIACFPAGTVSGAPKIRAMEIIDRLEPEARGPYAGAVGYLSYSGDLDTCITIRTLVVRPGEVSFTAGAGIVADSDPESERLETESKAAAMLAAVELAMRLRGR